MPYNLGQFIGEDIIYMVMMLAIPCHLLVAATLLKYRKTAFDGSYFTLSISLLLSDTLMCAVKIVFGLLVRTPMGPGITVNGTETLIEWDKTLSSGFSIFFRNVNQWALASIAVNRFLVICFPTKATTLWTPLVTKAVIGGQWLVGTVVGVTFHPRMRIIRDPITGVDGTVPDMEQSTFWSVLVGVSNAASIVLIAVCYGAMFCMMRTHSRRIAAAMGKNNQQTNDARRTAEIKLAVQAVVFSLFLFPQVILSVLMLALPAPAPPPGGGPMDPARLPIPQSVTYLMYHFEYANYYSTSFVMLTMTRALREHVRKLIAGSPSVQTVRSEHRSVTNSVNPMGGGGGGGTVQTRVN